MQPTPIMLNSCAKAATAEEAQFRIDIPIAPARATRIIALDADGLELVAATATAEWNHARFYACAEDEAGGASGLRLRRIDGPEVDLVDELEGVDAVVMVAASGAGTLAAATIGAACVVRGIMTAGLVLGDGPGVGDALATLRPYARVLMVPAATEDLHELLRAIRA